MLRRFRGLAVTVLLGCGSGADVSGADATDAAVSCAADPSACAACLDDARLACAGFDSKRGHSHGLGLAVRDGVVLIATAISDGPAIGEVDVDGGIQETYMRQPLLFALDTELRALGEPLELPAREATIVGLVSVSDGFLLVYAEGWRERSALVAQHLDTAGAPDEEPVPLGAGEGGMLLPRPNAGPLLVAMTTVGFDNLRAVLLDEHGREQLAVELPGSVLGTATGGAFTGEAFLVPIVGLARSSDHSLLRIGLDGSVARAFALPRAMSQEGGLYYTNVAWDGDAAWVVWSNTYGDGVMCPEPQPPPTLPDGGPVSVPCEIVPSPLQWARLDRDGALIDGPHELAAERTVAVPLDGPFGPLLVSGEHPTSAEGLSVGLLVRRLGTEMQVEGESVRIVADAEVNTFRALVDTDGAVFVAFTQPPPAHEAALGSLTVAKVRTSQDN